MQALQLEKQRLEDELRKVTHMVIKQTHFLKVNCIKDFSDFLSSESLSHYQSVSVGDCSGVCTKAFSSCLSHYY